MAQPLVLLLFDLTNYDVFIDYFSLLKRKSHRVNNALDFDKPCSEKILVSIPPFFDGTAAQSDEI